MMTRRTHLQKLTTDTSGATIVIALVFFLICAAVGSTVLATASVNAQTAATYRDTQQAENVVGSAAILFAGQFEGASVTCGADSVTGKLRTVSFGGSDTFESFWGVYGDTVLGAFEGNSPTTVPGAGTFFTINASGGGAEVTDPVFVKISIDSDLNLTATMSLDEGFSHTSPYNIEVFFQSVQKYDYTGNLVGMEWRSPVITKAKG